MEGREKRIQGEERENVRGLVRLGRPRAKKEARSGVRDRGPRRRREVRLWGTEAGENGRPGEKRVRRSRSERREWRVKKILRSKKGGKKRWGRVVERERDAERYGAHCGRDPREAIKRYVKRVRERHPHRRRENQTHERRLKRENDVMVGGRERSRAVREKCGVRRTSRGEGEGVEQEGRGRKARREARRREGDGAWGRKRCGRDRRSVATRRPKQRIGVWRTKEKRGVEDGLGRSEARRSEEVAGCGSFRRRGEISGAADRKRVKVRCGERVFCSGKEREG
jgi:hypothetical protein